MPKQRQEEQEGREQGFQKEPHVRMYVKSTLTVSMWIETKLSLENNEHGKHQEQDFPLSQWSLEQEN